MSQPTTDAVRLSDDCRATRPEAPPWPDIEIVFLDEPEDERDEVDTFMHAVIMPRVGETIRLDGDFRRRGAFVVERVEYLLCCDSRSAGWVRDLSVHVSLFVREN